MDEEKQKNLETFSLISYFSFLFFSLGFQYSNTTLVTEVIEKTSKFKNVKITLEKGAFILKKGIIFMLPFVFPYYGSGTTLPLPQQNKYHIKTIQILSIVLSLIFGNK